MNGKFPNGLKEAMVEAGVGPSKLARFINTSRQNVSRWSKGTLRLKPEDAKLLAPFLKTTPDRLLLIDCGQEKIYSMEPALKIPVVGATQTGGWFDTEFGKEADQGTIPTTASSYPHDEQTAYLVRDNAVDHHGIVADSYVVTVPYWRHRRVFRIGDIVVVERWRGILRERSVRVVRDGDDGSIRLGIHSSDPDIATPDIIFPPGAKVTGEEAPAEILGLVVMTCRVYAPRD